MGEVFTAHAGHRDFEDCLLSETRDNRFAYRLDEIRIVAYRRRALVQFEINLSVVERCEVPCRLLDLTSEV